MKKLLVFCLYGDEPKYLNGAVENARLRPFIYPGWSIRFYIDPLAAQAVGHALREMGAETVVVKSADHWIGHSKQFWRLFATEDAELERFVCRDCDSRLNVREWSAVQEWESTSFKFHVMRDHPCHANRAFPVFGGMWGAVKNAVPPLIEKAIGWIPRFVSGPKWTEMEFLTEHVWPLMRQNHIAHVSSYRGEGNEVPFQVSLDCGYFVGQRFDGANKPILEDNSQSSSSGILARRCEVSVLMSLYRGEKYLEEHLRRFAEQTIFQKVQLVICHNLPTERELETIQKFDIKHPGVIKHIVKNKLTTWSESMNECARQADSDLLAIGNVDDIRFPDSLRCQVEFLQRNPDYDVVHGNFIMVKTFGSNEGWRLVNSPFVNGYPELFKEMRLGPFFVWRKSAMEKHGYFDEQFRVSADFDLAMRLARRVKIGSLEMDLGFYLDEGLGLSTRDDGVEILERTAIKMRYHQDLLEQEFQASKRKEIEQYSLSDIRWFGETYKNWIADFLAVEPKSLANSAIVIVPSWNTEKWTEKCLRSVLEQTYKDLGIIFIDDFSSDQTLKIAQTILTGRRNTIVISRPERWQALKNWNSVIREQCSNPESVIFQLDGDDWLSCPTAIEEMMTQHQTADVAWSKYVATDGSPCCCSIIRTNDWRNSPWVTSHMRSFKKFLFDAIKPEDFLDWNGKIYELNYDQAIMLPILEMTITERLCFYDKELYVYNRDNPINDDKTHSPQDGWLTTCHIRSRKPYSRHPRYILPKPKPVSVVISSYNQLESLKLALESFYLQSELPKEVIVADDGSTDGTLEWLGSVPEGKYPFLLHHVTRQHNGYRLASLQNLGAKKATGDRLLFTNADVVHCPTSISSHGRLADNLFGTGVISSISEEGAKKVTVGHVLNHSLLKKLAEEYPAERNNLVWRKFGPGVHPSAVWGGNLSVSREIFNRIGGFDEGYDVGWGGEDTSLAKRCWERAGVTLVWVDQSVVYHLGHPVKSYALEQKGTERFNATQS